MNNSNIKTAIFWVVIIMVVVLFWTVVHNNKTQQSAQLSYTQLMNDDLDLGSGAPALLP